ncbi:MAG: hypothetical protein WAN11_04970, partial [Syntrophobacteraceae bacterium]
MKKPIFLVIVFVFSFVACGAAAGNVILEYKDVQFLKVHETRRGPNVSLELSGLAFHSSLAVESIETQEGDGCMIVL